jgi:hypothetical protein
MAPVTDLGIDGDGILQPLLTHRFKIIFIKDGDKEIDILKYQTISAEGFYLSNQGDSIRLQFEVDRDCRVLQALQALRVSDQPITIKIHSMDGDNSILMSIILKKCEMREMFIGQETSEHHRLKIPAVNEKEVMKRYIEFTVARSPAATFSFDYASCNSMKAKVEFDYMNYELEFPVAS